MPECCRYAGRHLDQPEPLVPLPLGRVCVVCKGVTYTARPRQTKYGVHPMCGPDTYTDHLNPEAETEVWRLLLDTFPGSLVTVKART